MKKALLILCILFVAASFSYYQQSTELPTHFPKSRYDFVKHPLSKAKIELGRRLFYDPILSRNNTISCESCHSPYSAFTHIDHALSHGISDSIGTRNSPALFNLAWQSSFMWDGAINNIEVQALAPISHPVEMGSSIQEVVKKLNASSSYRSNFYAAFNDSVVSGQYVLQALSQFMLSLVSANSKYDSMLRHELSFTEQEQRGYALFQNHCSTCHAEPLLSTYAFETNALAMDTLLTDVGRMRITKLASDSLKFKTPSLRNVAYTYPYMHDGRFKKLGEVINHYSTALVSNTSLSKRMRRTTAFSAEEKVDLISFLLTASDREFTFNKAHGPLK